MAVLLILATITDASRSQDDNSLIQRRAILKKLVDRHVQNNQRLHRQERGVRCYGVKLCLNVK